MHKTAAAADLIPDQRALFDIPEDVCYLNCASHAPLLRAAVAAGEMGIARKAHPWLPFREAVAAEAEEARALFAGLIGARADDIAIVPATSYGVAVGAANLPLRQGGTVVVLEAQFSSNYYMWRTLADDGRIALRVISRPDDDDWTSAVLEAIDAETTLVALPPCHWTDGTRLDLEAIGARARANGASFVVDATQAAGAMPIDVARWQPDFLVASGYKWLMCPYNIGFLYAAPHRQAGRPIEQHAKSRRGADSGLGYPDPFQDGARRYDMGERNALVALPMAVAGLRQLHAWTPRRIAATLGVLTQAIAEEAASRGYRVPAPDRRVSHYLRVGRGTAAPADLQDRLAARNVHVTLRGTGVRVSPHLFNRMRDVTRLFDALDEAWPER